MEKLTGRHRKPLRGWRERLRWMLGSLLATVLCSAAPARPEQSAFRPHPERSLLLEAPPTITATGRGTGERSAGEDLLVLLKRTPEVREWRVPSPRDPYPSERGWCVDDDGVRGVRPYLFHDLERARADRTRTSVREAPGEFDDLAAAVRTWLSLAT